MTDIQADDGYTNEKRSSLTQMIYVATAVVGFGLNAWWLTELLTATQVAQVKEWKEADIWKYQVVNAISFGVCFVLNMTAKYWQKTSQQGTVAQWQVLVTPAGWAFAIWGIIFLFIFGFTVYQALPQAWVPSRHNDVIFGQIGWLFAINQNVQSLWLLVWQFSNVTAFLVDLWVILVMDVTGFVILQYSIVNDLNGWEFTLLRCGFSIYIGWITAATILGIAYFSKANGFCEDQQTWALYYLWSGFVLYNVYSYLTINPLFGLIFVWVLLGSRSRAFKEDNMKIHAGVQILLKVYGVAWIGQVVYAVVSYSSGKAQYGLLY